MSNYRALKEKAINIKGSIPILNYFHKLEAMNLLRYEGKQGKEFFFGYPDQRTGSISIDEQSNLWYDHSSGKGGDIIEAVQFFERKTFFEAITSLSNDTPIETTINRGKTQEDHKISLISKRSIEQPALISYISSRGLKLEEIADLAYEIHWRNGDKKYFAVGFENDQGGWVLRSSIFKGNILAGGISTIPASGSRTFKVFEGWFDFLSYRKLSKPSIYNAIILNSTSNFTPELMFFLIQESRGGSIDLYLDNDSTGVGYTKFFFDFSKLVQYCVSSGHDIEAVIKKVGGKRDRYKAYLEELKLTTAEIELVNDQEINAIDHSDVYREHVDLNAFLKDYIKK